MGKTRDLFKEIRDTKGIFHAKMFTTKDRYGMDLREAEDIKKWQECTGLYKKKIVMIQIAKMPRLLPYSQQSWNVRSSGP